MSTFDDEDPDYMDYSSPLFTAEDEHSLFTSARSVSHHVSSKQSPHFKAFYKHNPVQLTLDTGAETSMIQVFSSPFHRRTYYEVFPASFAGRRSDSFSCSR